MNNRLEVLGKHLAKDLGLKVEVVKKGASFSEGEKTIYLPEVVNAKFEDFYLSALGHEAAHCRYGSAHMSTGNWVRLLEAPEMAGKGKRLREMRGWSFSVENILHRFHNYVEDIRVNTMLGEEYPGFIDFYRAWVDHLDKDWKKEKEGPGSLELTLYTILREAEGFPLPEGVRFITPDGKAELVVLQKFTEARNCRTSFETAGLVPEIFDALYDLIEKELEQKQEQEKKQEGQGEGEEGQKMPGGKAESSSEAGSGDQSNTEAKPNQNSQEQESDRNGGSDSDEESKSKAEDIEENKKREQESVMSKLEELAENTLKKRGCGLKEVKAKERASKKNSTSLVSNGKVNRRVVEKLLTKQIKTILGNERIAPKRLGRLFVNPEEIFTADKVSKKPVGIHFLLDISGSMEGRTKGQNQSKAHILAASVNEILHAINNLQGVKTEIVQFNDVARTVKAYNDKKARPIQARANGGTDISEAFAATKETARRFPMDRHFFIIFTDGGVEGGEAGVLAELSRKPFAGKTAGIVIAPCRPIKGFSYIQSSAEIGWALQDALRRIIV